MATPAPVREARAATPSRRSLLGLVLLIAAVAGGSQWWFARAEARIGDEIARLAQAGDIRMLSSTTCAYCSIARAWFEQRKVPFDECFIETDAACRAAFDSLRAEGTPMVLVRGQAQTGFAPERVLGRCAGEGEGRRNASGAVVRNLQTLAGSSDAIDRMVKSCAAAS